MAEFDFVLNYTLIQQTPYIHFQPDETEAILRATEVKPKLDKFLINLKGGWSKVSPSWKAGGENTALDYKMQFKAKNLLAKSETREYQRQLRRAGNDKTIRGMIKRQYANKLINGMFFANMAPKSGCSDEEFEETLSKYKEAVFYDEVLLKIVCLNDELREFIAANIRLFFLLNNFGCRQSKGFGGFILDGSQEEDYKVLETYLINQSVASFYAEFEQQHFDGHPQRADQLLKYVKIVYSVMKGGINAAHWKFTVTTNGRLSGSYESEAKYVKGFIQREYLNVIQKDAGSEKEFMKRNVLPQNFISSFTNRNSVKIQYNNYLFIRVLLGMADQYEFSDAKIDNYTHKAKSNTKKVRVFQIEGSDFGIERFKSPLQIKMVHNRVYFILNMPEEVLNKEFCFILEEDLKKMDAPKSATAIYQNPNTKKLRSPSTFDTVAFVKNFIRYLDEQKEKHPDMINRQINLKIVE